ncbi:MAG: hypothetical protein HF962_06400 [Sulfurovum sp.]|nr:hypothetical protein [Sulfurovum sp.]
MKLKKDTLEKLTNFMLGVAWAIVFIGAISAFTYFTNVNFIAAILSAFLGTIPGLMMVLCLEYLMLKSEKLKEMKKQTAILEEIIDKIKAN